MQVHCPHCQTVFPSERAGAQSCPHCGREVNVPEAEVHATPLAPDLGQPTPWERRRELGVLPAFFQTWKEVMFSPEAFWGKLRPTASVWDALSFAWIIAFVEMVLNALEMRLTHFPDQLLSVLTGGVFNLPAATQEALTRMAAAAPQRMLAGYLVWMVFFPFWFFVLAGLIHLACRVCGAGANGFDATARALGYSWAPLILSWIPCLNVVAAIYWSVLQVWGIAQAQRARAGTVVVAMLLLTLVTCCLCLSPLAFLWPMFVHWHI